MTPIQQHLQMRPAMPHPFHPDSAEAIAWHRAFQAWVDTKERLEICERVAGIVIDLVDHNKRACTPRANWNLPVPN